jgi:hypothetical protein
MQIPKKPKNIRELVIFSLLTENEHTFRAEELMEHFERVMGPYVNGNLGEELQRHYEEAVNGVREIYKTGDYGQNFTYALQIFHDTYYCEDDVYED